MILGMLLGAAKPPISTALANWMASLVGIEREERLVLSRADGSRSIIARDGDSTPAGPVSSLQG